jgi:hypothetical protein
MASSQRPDTIFSFSAAYLGISRPEILISNSRKKPYGHYSPFYRQRDSGTLQLAGRSIGASFVGAAAATLVVAELVRLAIGGPRYALISCHLRDLDGRTVIAGQPWAPFNPGSVQAAA